MSPCINIIFPLQIFYKMTRILYKSNAAQEKQYIYQKIKMKDNSVDLTGCDLRVKLLSYFRIIFYLIDIAQRMISYISIMKLTVPIFMHTMRMLRSNKNLPNQTL